MHRSRLKNIYIYPKKKQDLKKKKANKYLC